MVFPYVLMLAIIFPISMLGFELINFDYKILDYIAVIILPKLILLLKLPKLKESIVNKLLRNWARLLKFIQKGGIIMPICTNCNNKWSWKQTVKKTMILNYEINHEMFCPYCGEKQYRSNKSKNIIPFIVPIMLLPIIIQIFFDVPILILLSLIPLLAIIIFILFPFSIKLSSEKESPF